MRVARQIKEFLFGRVLIAHSIPGISGPTFDEVWPHIKKVEGWLVPGQERWLFRTTRQLPHTANIVEIGAFKGRSTVSIGTACVRTSKRVFSIDTFQGNTTDFIKGQNDVDWSGDSFFHEFWTNVVSLGIQNHVIPLAGSSSDIARCWRAPIHFLFVDGSHQYDDVLNDFQNFFPFVVSGGIVAFHDVTPEWSDVYEIWHKIIKPQLVNVGNETTLAFGNKP